MKARPPDLPPPQPVEVEASAIAAEAVRVAIAVEEGTKQLEDQCG